MDLNWLPDWKDESQYSSSLYLDQWHWEFLRRREDYQEDWEKYFPISYSENIEAFREHELPEGILSWEDHFKNFAEMPSINGKPGCREKYGAKIIWNPSHPTPPFDFFEYSYGSLLTYASEKKFKEYKKDNIVFVKFDLKQPLNKQLEKAKSQLLHFQENKIGKIVKEKRKHTNKWKLYLRVLDARLKEVTFEEIGRELFGEISINLPKEQYDYVVNKEDNYKASAKQIWDAAREVMFKQFV